jgi:hypothetical protein
MTTTKAVSRLRQKARETDVSDIQLLGVNRKGYGLQRRWKEGTAA